MPPKKQQQPSTKAVDSAKKKEIEDKTFGLKNKKSAKVAKYIAQLETQSKSSKEIRKQQEQANEKRKNAEMEEKREKELREIFKPVVHAQEVQLGVDPKTVLCLSFKAGYCAAGKNCKFSHSWDVERKGAKINLYVDQRMLDAPVSTAAAGKNTPTTDIICRYFLAAVKEKKYGFFWLCPNGESCIYQHALPDGYVVECGEKDKDKEAQISVEEYVETERNKLNAAGPMVTEESFRAWKEKRCKGRKVKNANTGRMALDRCGYKEDGDGDGDDDDDADMFDIDVFLNDKGDGLFEEEVVTVESLRIV